MLVSMICAVLLMLGSGFGKGVPFPDVLGFKASWQDVAFVAGLAIWGLAYVGRILYMMAFRLHSRTGAYLGPCGGGRRGPITSITAALGHVFWRKGGFGCAVATMLTWGILWAVGLVSAAGPRTGFLLLALFAALPMLALLIGAFRVARGAEQAIRLQHAGGGAGAGASKAGGAGAVGGPVRRSVSGNETVVAGGVAAGLAAAGVVYALEESASRRTADDNYPASNSLVDNDSVGSDPFTPAVNVDGTPMVGSLDIHGNPYGVTQIETPQYDPPQFDAYQPVDTGSSGGFGGGWND